jgi:hypothetical protein
LPLSACGPLTGAQLKTALGASVEPLLYIMALWMLRDRPAAFGGLLCFASLHREFTLFALAPVLLLQWIEYREIRWPPLLKAAGAFALVWMAIDQLKQHAARAAVDGPGVSTGSLALEAVQVGHLLSFRPSVYCARLHVLVTQGLPDLFGARPVSLIEGGIWGSGTMGSRFAGVVLTAAAIVAAGRLIWSGTKDGWVLRPFHAFLGLVAIQAILAYGLHGGSDIESRTELNYVLLALLLPVAVFGAYFAVERNVLWARAVMTLVAVWAMSMSLDNGRVARQYIVHPPGNLHRELADYLTTHRIKWAWAGYWDSYRITFLAHERVIVASTETVRIPDYQTRVERNRLNAARLVRIPCDQGTRVAEWCVIAPF